MNQFFLVLNPDISSWMFISSITRGSMGFVAASRTDSFDCSILMSPLLRKLGRSNFALQTQCALILIMFLQDTKQAIHRPPLPTDTLQGVLQICWLLALDRYPSFTHCAPPESCPLVQRDPGPRREVLLIFCKKKMQLWENWSCQAYEPPWAWAPQEHEDGE